MCFCSREQVAPKRRVLRLAAEQGKHARKERVAPQVKACSRRGVGTTTSIIRQW